MGQILEQSDAGPTHEVGPGLELRWPASALWRPGEPAIRKIGLADLQDAVAKGIDDFKAVPTHLIFLVLFYPVIGLILGQLLLGHHTIALVYPFVAGLALIGPAVAIGLYEISRRREQGLQTSIKNGLDVLKSPSIGAIGQLAVFMLALFMAWLGLAKTLYHQLLGGWTPTSLQDLFHHVVTTPGGHQLVIVGNVLGFLFAVFALVVSVISFPMLVDRNVSAANAVRTSIRAVIDNPVTMAMWGLFVVLALLIGALPFFIGLAVVLPVLGHATWHLYRKVVER